MTVIDLIETIHVDDASIQEQLLKFSTNLRTATDLLDDVDVDQDSQQHKKKLRSLSVETEKLMHSLKLIKSAFDSSDGYTSTEEEEKAYGAMSADLSSLIGELGDIVWKIVTYKA
mmetsp:Transcript_7496/g.8460  ORF Transcript_7496/g.8460 Transcript_7496/m.8460 type:complete len:115 (-) Transcript_7496:229-573(-)|eukprot:CAMPEP_0168319628 /NCGR_PEP_ID=MMETSP0213-20121227/1168_1 /TAXON_ID=151035 /ORGANISM="Euplotes harpa, Strain FSP1.4" /LENGTH=114 /DNA_ID=CAMNT_0008320883 /DNA_START=209 /DNA_END=553 /DNA_ORIENTATION=+